MKMSDLDPPSPSPPLKWGCTIQRCINGHPIIISACGGWYMTGITEKNGWNTYSPGSPAYGYSNGDTLSTSAPYCLKQATIPPPGYIDLAPVVSTSTPQESSPMQIFVSIAFTRTKDSITGKVTDTAVGTPLIAAVSSDTTPTQYNKQRYGEIIRANADIDPATLIIHTATLSGVQSPN